MTRNEIDAKKTASLFKELYQRSNFGYDLKIALEGFMDIEDAKNVMLMLNKSVNDYRSKNNKDEEKKG